MQSSTFYILCFVSILILYGFICGSNGNYNPDLRYLFNRATQIYNCFSDEKLPWFYYNDFQGVGYGSSFFYGQLTLIPFCFLRCFSSTESLSFPDFLS